MDNRNKIKIILIGIIIAFTNCIGGGSKDQHPDPYYHETGGWDYRRIPLIKPLELISNDKMTWNVNSYPPGYKVGLNSISSIEKINQVKNKLFLFRSIGFLSVGGESFSSAWFLIDTEEKRFYGYADYQTFSDSLKIKYDIQIDTTTWKSPDDYYREFIDTRKLPWIPEWKKDN